MIHTFGNRQEVKLKYSEGVFTVPYIRSYCAGRRPVYGHYRCRSFEESGRRVAVPLPDTAWRPLGVENGGYRRRKRGGKETFVTCITNFFVYYADSERLH